MVCRTAAKLKGGDVLSSRSLLLIDADPAVHEYLGGLLKRNDREIQNAYDGPDALRRLHDMGVTVLLWALATAWLIA